MEQLSEMELDGNPRSSRVRLNVRLLLVSFILLGAPITIIVVVWYQNSLQSAQTQYRGTVQYSIVQYRGLLKLRCVSISSSRSLRQLIS